MAAVVYLVAMGVAVTLAAVAVMAAGAGPKVVNLLIQIVRILLYPVFAVTVTLLYYDLRIRKEGFDIEVMAGELGGRFPAAPTRAAV